MSTIDRSGVDPAPRVTHAIQCGPRASLWISYAPVVVGMDESYQILADFAKIRRFRPKLSLRPSQPLHRIEFLDVRRPLSGVRESYVALTCSSCGNDRNFLVKTLQMHVVRVEDGRVEVTEETQPAVLEVLCDECETALKFEDFEDTLRKEVLLTIGAR